MPKHKSGYLLPPDNEIETPDRICVQFQMPNTEEYRIAVMGQIFELCKWWSWDKTTKGDTRASRASHMFRDTALETFQFIDECLQSGVNVIFRQTDCTLEASTDDGQTWTVIFDANPCKPVIVYQDGDIIVDGEVVVSGDTIINNVIIQPDTDHIKGDGLDKRCNLATYLVEVPLPSLANDLISEYQNANGNTNNFMLAMLAIGAVVVTGGWALGAIPAISAGLALGSIAGVGAYTAVNAVMDAIDITATIAEMDSVFWNQDLKCVIYCNLNNDAILDDEQMQTIANAIESDLASTYPNASQLLGVIFRTMSPESRGQYQIYGSLYAGHDCNLCACSGWVAYVRGYPYVSKYINLLGTTTKWPNGGVFYDGAWTDRDSMVQLEIDLSKTPAYITGLTVQGASYKDKYDSGDRYVKLEVWDEANKNYVTVWSAPASTVGADSFRNLNGGTPGVPYPLMTTKIKITQEGWGENQGMSWDNNYISVINVYGAGLNVFQIENDEYNGV